MNKAKQLFTLTATNKRTHIMPYRKLKIPTTHGEINTKVLCAPAIKEKLLSVKELTDNKNAVIFMDEKVYLKSHNKL